MSGGSYGYICYKLSEECEGRMHDAELNELVKDLSEVLHDLEWWQSADTSEERYRRTVRSFKRKWFVPDARERTLEKIINEKTDNLRTELLEMIGEPIVRCKDCEQYNGKIECGNGLLTEPDDFCSFGVRKEAKHETD